MNRHEVYAVGAADVGDRIVNAPIDRGSEWPPFDGDGLLTLLAGGVPGRAAGRGDAVRADAERGGEGQDRGSAGILDAPGAQVLQRPDADPRPLCEVAQVVVDPARQHEGLQGLGCRHAAEGMQNCRKIPAHPLAISRRTADNCAIETTPTAAHFSGRATAGANQIPEDPMTSTLPPLAPAATCSRCPSPRDRGRTMCAQHNAEYDAQVKALRVSFEWSDGPEFCWRGLAVQTDYEGARLIDAHVDCPIEFEERFGLPVTNEHAREVAAEGLREWAADFAAAHGEAADKWAQEQRDEARIDRADDGEGV